MFDNDTLHAAFPHSRLAVEDGITKVYTKLNKLFNYKVEMDELTEINGKLCFGLTIALNAPHSYIDTDEGTRREVVVFEDKTYQIELNEQQLKDTIAAVARTYAAQYDADLIYEPQEIDEIVRNLLSYARKIRKVDKIG